MYTTPCLDVSIMLQVVHHLAKQEMGQNEELVMKILIATQMEFASQLAPFKDQKAME